IDVLYEDADLLVVNKPAGLLAVPDRYDKTLPNLWDLLRQRYQLPELTNPHRLDRYTSGVMIFTKHSQAYRRLTAQFRDRLIRKEYLAICHGTPVGQSITLPVGERVDRPGLARIDLHNGKTAETHIAVKEAFRQHSLLSIVIATGRLHQIRVHLQAIGHPLVGDADYGGAPLYLSALKPNYKPKPNEPEHPLMNRPALHANAITLSDPPRTFCAPLPDDFEVALRYLRRFAAQRDPVTQT
ncbi:MAG: RluA family pseudouridine synthase, partial [Verrucomicrobiae bacterium]|nr:RluA family pseudouridine synthase [Verrucomicrobiae bacterium]